MGGYRNIVSVVIAEPVIQQMRQRYSDLQGLLWQAMDATALQFADSTFDVAIEKGLFDALYAGTGTQAQPVLDEVKRVLRPTGRFVSVSFAADRIDHLFAVPEADGPAASEPSKESAALSCRVAGELHHAKKSERDSHEDREANSKTKRSVFYIYAC